MSPVPSDALPRIASALGVLADPGGAPNLEAVLARIADLRRDRDERFADDEATRKAMGAIGIPRSGPAGRRSTRDMVIDLMHHGRALHGRHERAKADDRDIREVLQGAGVEARRDGRDVSTPAMVRELVRLLHIIEAMVPHGPDSLRPCLREVLHLDASADDDAILSGVLRACDAGSGEATKTEARADLPREVYQALGLRDGMSREVALEAMRELARDATAIRELRHHAQALQAVVMVLNVNLAELLPSVPADRR